MALKESVKTQQRGGALPPPVSVTVEEEAALQVPYYTSTLFLHSFLLRFAAFCAHASLSNYLNFHFVITYQSTHWLYISQKRWYFPTSCTSRVI